MPDVWIGVERRTLPGADRRKYARSGRRSGDPRRSSRWRRIMWLFAAYAAYLGIRSVPAKIQQRFKRVHS
jgi:hypothetical protein